METIAATTAAQLRDVAARALLRVRELEARVAELEMENRELWERASRTVAPTRRRYETEEDRLEAARKTWRDSKRRRRARLAAA